MPLSVVRKPNKRVRPTLSMFGSHNHTTKTPLKSIISAAEASESHLYIAQFIVCGAVKKLSAQLVGSAEQ